MGGPGGPHRFAFPTVPLRAMLTAQASRGACRPGPDTFTAREWPDPHVRHRRFTDWVERSRPGWSLQARIPNAFPYDAADPDGTSFADFFVFERVGPAAGGSRPA